MQRDAILKDWGWRIDLQSGLRGGLCKSDAAGSGALRCDAMRCIAMVALRWPAMLGQGSTAHRSAAKRGPGRAPAQREGSRWFMYDTWEGGGQLTGRCESSRIDCRTVSSVRLCGVH